MKRHKHLNKDEVDDLRNRCRRTHRTDKDLSRQLGISRVHLNNMFNHRSPMRRIYKTVLESTVLQVNQAA